MTLKTSKSVNNGVILYTYSNICQGFMLISVDVLTNISFIMS
jgi:hypothetical protein